MTQQVLNIPQLDDGDEYRGKTLKDYLKILSLNIIPIIIIFVICTVAAILYTLTLKDMYCSTTKLKIEDKKENILEATFPAYNEAKSETFILTQIEILKSYYIRDWVAKALIDSVKAAKNTDNYTVLIKTNPGDNSRSIIKQEELRVRLNDLVSFEQPVSKVNVLDIKSRNFDFDEARLISSTYADVFVEYTKEIGRLDITAVKNYLAGEKEKKFAELNESEAALEEFQKRTGLVTLESQAENIVENISTYEAARSNSDIEIKAANNSLSILNGELRKIDPEFSSFIESQLNTPYLDELAKQIATMEVKRDIELSVLKDDNSKQRVLNSYNDKLYPLKKSYEEKSNSFKEGVLSKTPAEMQMITGKILDANLSLSASYPKYNILSRQLNKYEAEFNKLPSSSIQLAKLERARKSTEKLYLILEEKFQEASINERSRIGNASLLDPGTDNTGPVGPNRKNIIIFGIGMGLIIGFLFALGRDFLNRSIKEPEDLEKLGIGFLTWIPTVPDIKKSEPSRKVLIVRNMQDASSEAFKALRTRIQYSKLKSESLKSILVTSSLPSEGKSFVAVNLAGTFALNGKKTLMLDCDLRKPKVHSIMESDRYPGLCDLLYNNFELNDITRKSVIDNLDYITCGTIPPNPSELLGSEQMDLQLREIEKLYDVVIIDSPPFLSVTDAEILFNITNGTILVARAGKTPKEAFLKAFNKLKDINPHNLLGCILNDFSYSKAYSRYYYNHYYYNNSFNSPDNGKRKK